MRVGYIKDENGKLVRKFIKEADVHLEENKDLLYQVNSKFGDYLWTDEEHMEEAKEILLENMFNAIRKLAMMDEFWIVRKPSDYENFVHPVLPGAKIDVPQEAKDGKSTVGWKVDFPQFEGFYTNDVAEQIEKKLYECFNCEKE